MAAESLRDELLGLPGVAEVELDGDGGAPAGVRIRLAAGADPDRVGLEVQRVLAAHGMRSRVDDSAVAPPPLLPLVVPAPPPEEEAVPGPAGAPAALGSVRVEESATAVEVTVIAADGRQATRRGAVSEEGLAEAVIEAVGILLVGAPPRVIAVDWATADGSRVVTVVLESPGGAKGAGAGLVRASRAYAVARAAWSALAN
ncbi:MAG: hypothetical protein ABIJ48_05575 [Actinomycetota bacterium]